MRLAAVFLLLAAAASPGQQPPQEVFGTAIIHVTCADTNQPARLASVSLVRTGELIPSGSLADTKDPVPAGKTTPITTFRTGLDGSVTLPEVAPGRYYVVVQQTGYLSPVAQFSREDINHPDETTRSLIENTIPVVVVAAHQASTVDVRLTRAAVITGTIRYDDGSAAIDAGVELKRHSKTGEWVPVGAHSYGNTDDQGRYRIAGLAAGEYRVSAQLRINTTIGTNVFGSVSSSYTSFGYALFFFAGDTLRAADAKTFKLADGEISANHDITIPVSRLHSVTGSLIDAKSGTVLNHGYLALHLGDDKETIAQAQVDPVTQTFRFDFILEGGYRLNVSDATQLRREEIAPAAASASAVSPPRYKDTILKSYGPYEAPFLVQSDVTGLTLPMPPAPAKQ